MQNNIIVYKKWCKSCGICTAFCPKKALTKDELGYPFLKDAMACSGCGLCELRCPDFAIIVEGIESPDSIGPKEDLKVVVGGKDDAESPVATGK